RENAIGIETLEFGLGLKHHTMPQHRRDSSFYVIRNEVVAAVEGCDGLSDAHQAQGGTGAGAEEKSRPLASASCQGEDVAVEFRLDANRTHLGTCSLEHLRLNRRDRHVIEQA